LGVFLPAEPSYRIFIADAPVPYHEIDRSGVIVYVNMAECELLGLQKDQMLGHPVWEFVAPEERDQSRDAVLRKLAGGQPLMIFERVYIRPDGTLVMLEIHEKHILDDESRITGMSSFLIDITDRKRSEQALQLNQQRYEHLMQHASDIVYGADINGNFVFFNPTATVLLGYPAEELIGRSYLDIVRPDYRFKMRRFYRAQLARNQGDTYFEFPAIARDGREVWFGQNVQLIQENGKSIGFQAITRDITKQHRIESQGKQARGELERMVQERTAELERSNSQLRREMEERRRAEEQRIRLEAQIQHAQRLESLGILAGGIAHDFNNLLTAMMGYASMAKLLLPEHSPALSSIDSVLAASKSAAQLTQQMLAYSGRGKFVVESIDISEFVQETSRFALSLVSKKATIRYQLAPDTPMIQVDVAQLRQILINLLTNASDALNDNPGFIDVKTGSLWIRDNEFPVVGTQSTLNAGEYVFLEVSDTGCGMDHDTVARIFDPFFTTKFTGRGLGLAAVMGIVRGHSGTLDVQSNLGEGSRFRVFFPTSHSLAPTRSAQVESDWTKWTGRGVVLVVDDEPLVRQLAAETLKRAGLTVITAIDGPDGMRQFKANMPMIGAVLLDMTMPGMNGIEVFQQISAIAPNVKVFLCSGYNMQGLDGAFGLDGLAGFLRKPYLPRELIKCVRSAFAAGDLQKD
jgi:two-component system cell cycle sensor histidine kinase/response regulator CckA